MKLEKLKDLDLNEGDEICVTGDMAQYYEGIEGKCTIGIYKGYEEKDGIDYLLLEDRGMREINLRDVRVIGSEEDEYFVRLLSPYRIIEGSERMVDDAFCNGKFQLDDKGDI